MAPFVLEDPLKYITKEVLDYDAFNRDINKINFHTKCLITTVNRYSYMIAEKDKAYKKALISSDILLHDNININAAAKPLDGETVTKVGGADIHQHLLQKLNHEGGSCFYLGASEPTLAAIKKRLSKEYPKIKVGSYSPPFKANFSIEEDNAMIEAVNAFKPQVLFLGMTSPKQEKWAYKYKDQLDAHVICAIGAIFYFYAETVNHLSEPRINLGLGRAIQLVKEPGHIAKKYLYYGPLFVCELLKGKLLGLVSTLKFKLRQSAVN
ncbi:WecB/TagA/CpsF family glycosyltransferase [Mucilaginibacter panaciglaebae]|uniref:WecB/TagA/CpsF family glycosyltransferase n=1 Tax=Mucilaginibacter panaciglaebae TaxID=502331 RepID=A0ABP7WJB9_9SPHI